MATVESENSNIKKSLNDIKAENRARYESATAGAQSISDYLGGYGVGSTGGAGGVGGNRTVGTAGSGMDQLAAMQKQAKQAELMANRRKTLSDLEAEKSATNLAYKNQINQTNTNADIALKNYFENVANRGQTYSGSTSQGELAQNIARQNNVSGLQSAQAAALADIARRKSLAEQNYTDNLQNAYNQIDLTAMQNKLNQEASEKDNQYKQAQLMAQLGDYSGLRNLGYDTTSLETAKAQEAETARIKQQNEVASQALNKAKLMADMGDFSGLKALGYDTTALEKQWNANLAKVYASTAKSSGGGSSGGTSTSSMKSIVDKAQSMLNETESIFGGDIIRNKYGPVDVIRYVNAQSISTSDKRQILDSLGLSGFFE